MWAGNFRQRKHSAKQHLTSFVHCYLGSYDIAHVDMTVQTPQIDEVAAGEVRLTSNGVPTHDWWR